MPQLTYNAGPVRALVGQRRAAMEDSVHHGVLETVAGCEAGRLVKRGTAPNSFAVLAGAGDVALIDGITIRDNSKEASTPQFAQYSTIAAVHRGKVNMICVGAITPTSALYVVHTGANAGLPSLTNTNAVAVEGFKCTVGAADGEVGEFEINCPLVIDDVV